jgi:hypothetical protein
MPELWDALNTAQQPQAVPPDMWRAPMGVGSPAESAGAPSGMNNLAAGLYQYLGNLAKRSFGASEEMRGGGAYNPAPAVETALATMGGPLVGATPKAGEVAFGAGPIKAYHSSPHDFDKFDLSKIGTGEGAQAYGHGLYFAESPAVSGQGGQYWQQFKQHQAFSPAEAQAAIELHNAGFDRDAAKRMLCQRMKVECAHYGQRGAEEQQLYKEHLDALDLLHSGKPVGPRTYEVNINADPAHFLDWDKPLSGQPPIVQDMARNADLSHLDPGNRTRRQIEMWREGKLPNPESEPNGNVLHSALTDYGMNTGSNAALTDKFREAGIPGIKYLDQGSRSKAYTVQPTYKGEPYGDPVHFDHTHPAERWAQEQRDKGFGAEVKDTGSRNYVVFNDKLIDIMRKYGIAGAAGPPLAAGFGFPPADNEQRM